MIHASYKSLKIMILHKILGYDSCAFCSTIKIGYELFTTKIILSGYKKYIMKNYNISDES